MKRLLFFLLLLPAIGFSQKEYKATNNITYHVGDTVKLGLGSGNNGNFVYLVMGGWAALSNQTIPIGSIMANSAVIIKKIRSYKRNGITKYSFLVGGGNISNYALIIDEAIQSCEVLPCKSS